jgi:hypothetical protein
MKGTPCSRGNCAPLKTSLKTRITIGVQGLGPWRGLRQRPNLALLHWSMVWGPGINSPRRTRSREAGSAWALTRLAASGRLRTGSFGVCNRDKQKFVVGTVDGKSRPIVSRKAHRDAKAGRLLRSPVLVVQRLFATGAAGSMDFGATKGHRLLSAQSALCVSCRAGRSIRVWHFTAIASHVTANELPMRRALWPPCLWRGPRPRW